MFLIILVFFAQYRQPDHHPAVDREFVSQVNDFIEKYEPALKEIAKK
jgi:hypothetical protein